jgi:hypothetical protein
MIVNYYCETFIVQVTGRLRQKKLFCYEQYVYDLMLTKERKNCHCFIFGNRHFTERVTQKGSSTSQLKAHLHVRFHIAFCGLPAVQGIRKRTGARQIRSKVSKTEILRPQCKAGLSKSTCK